MHFGTKKSFYRLCALNRPLHIYLAYFLSMDIRIKLSYRGVEMEMLIIETSHFTRTTQC